MIVSKAGEHSWRKAAQTERMQTVRRSADEAIQSLAGCPR